MRRSLVETEHRPDFSHAVIARDHMSYNISGQDLSAEFDAFMWALQNSETLGEAIRRLQSFEWLPVEGRDFTVSFESS